MLRSGVLNSEYTGKTIGFTRGDDKIEIDHVVALAEAWRTGASAWDQTKRERFANDPFNLAVETAVNQEKGDEPPIYWLPDIEQCDFINRYLSIKHLYRLGVTKEKRDWLFREWASQCDGGTVKLYQRADYKTPKARPIGEPKPKPKPSPRPEPEPERSDPPSVYYENCTAVRNAGKAPIHRGDPGYGSHLDRDDDGVACET